MSCGKEPISTPDPKNLRSIIQADAEKIERANQIISRIKQIRSAAPEFNQKLEVPARSQTKSTTKEEQEETKQKSSQSKPKPASVEEAAPKASSHRSRSPRRSHSDSRSVSRRH